MNRSDRPDPPATPDDDLARALRASRRLEDAPESVIQRAIGLWQHGARTAAPAAGPLRRLLARLVSDSALAPSALAFGQRGAGAPVRQLVFCTDGYDVDLRIVADTGAAAERWRLSGQVLGAQATGHVALRSAAGEPLAEVPIDELGEFRLPPVAGGAYVLALQLDGTEIELPPVGLPTSGLST